MLLMAWNITSLNGRVLALVVIWIASWQQATTVVTERHKFSGRAVCAFASLQLFILTIQRTRFGISLVALRVQAALSFAPQQCLFRTVFLITLVLPRTLNESYSLDRPVEDPSRHDTEDHFSHNTHQVYALS